jgi:hypothetical protein
MPTENTLRLRYKDQQENVAREIITVYCKNKVKVEGLYSKKNTTVFQRLSKTFGSVANG